jgi:hypothetical protein
VKRLLRATAFLFAAAAGCAMPLGAERGGGGAEAAPQVRYDCTCGNTQMGAPGSPPVCCGKRMTPR